MAGLMLVALTMFAHATASHAQQVLEIDYDVGRDVINSDWRAISIIDSHTAIDYDRGLLYVRDLEEPEGVMVFSLSKGEWVRTLSVPMGEGPHEVSQFSEMELATGGGIYVSNSVKVVHIDSLGQYASHWQPNAPARKAVCEFAGAPAVPTHGGVIRRGEGGGDEVLGPSVGEGMAGSVIQPATQESVDRVIARALSVSGARIACTDEAAYVVMSFQHFVKPIERNTALDTRYSGPDSIFVYFRDGRAGRLEVPNDFAPVTVQGRTYYWTSRLSPDIDKDGNIVLISNDGLNVAAILDPRSACYAVLRNRKRESFGEVKGIYQDSVLVFHRDREETTGDGKKVVTIYADARQASLHPLRRVSGEPCPNMLRSVGGTSEFPPVTSPYDPAPPPATPRWVGRHRP